MPTPPLRYLSADAVAACLPPATERVELAASALLALARDDAEMPPKIGVHPRPGALLHAMPAWLRGADLVGMKWVSAFPDNRSRGLPAIGGLIVLNDPDTGLPTWVLDAGVITAHRTAAVSGVAIRLFSPARVQRVGLVGAGVQARSHLELIAELLPGATVLLHDVHRERASALAVELGSQRGLAVNVVDSAQAAIGAADVVVTAATLRKEGGFIDPDGLALGALVIAIDFASCVRGTVATAARHFVTDDRAQYLAYRTSGYFDGYPDVVETLGETLDQRGLTGPVEADGRPTGADERPVLVSHLGVGLADVVFANAVAKGAERTGFGLELPR